MTTSLPANPVALGLEVHVDINARKALPLVFNRPPEAEGDTAGVLEAHDVESADAAGPYGSLAFQDANDVTITGGAISGVTLLHITIDGGEF